MPSTDHARTDVLTKMNRKAGERDPMPMDVDGTESTHSALVRSARQFNRWRERHHEAGLGVILGLQATTIFVVSPLAGVGLFSPEVTEALRFGLAATAILVVTRSRVIGASVALAYAILLLCTIYLRTGAAGHAIYQVNICLTIAFDLAVAWTVAHAAFDAGRITVYRIMGAVSLYLYVALIFASVDRLALTLLNPAFSGLSPTRRSNLSELLYFSMSALTTSGFGDIVPVHPFVRSLANLESLIGQLYPATFLARLVTLHGTVTERGPGRDKG
jgi:hypothetical protein